MAVHQFTPLHSRINPSIKDYRTCPVIFNPSHDDYLSMLGNYMTRSIRNHTIPLAATLLIISGCATTPVSPTQASAIPGSRISVSKYQQKPHAEPSSQLVFVRDSGLYGAGTTIYLFINGEEIAGFRPSETLKIFLAPGEYLIGVQSRPNFGLEQFIENPARIEPDQSYAFRIGIDYNKAIVQRTSAFKK